MDSDIPPAEIIEVEGDTFISIEYQRSWPKCVASWSARMRRGDTDYPLAAEIVETMPSIDGDPNAVWAELRTLALNAAHAAIATRVPAGPTHKSSLLSRVFGKGKG